MNVLSLFDGMSCGRQALKNLGIEVTNYFASEIDKHAIIIAQKNHPDNIQVGDVTKLVTKNGNLVVDGKEYKIDLLIGGSPCQGFSFAGKQLNFEDPRSKLFFELVRLKKELTPTFFLLENVKMKAQFQDIITEHMGVEPILINSNLVSTQSRQRLYWTNIGNITQPENKNLDVKDIIQKEIQTPNSELWHNWFKVKKEFQLKKRYSTILNLENKGICQVARQMSSWVGNLVQIDEESYRFATPIECERMQTLSDDYTEGVAKSHRYKMLGNGWTVSVIEHIFKGLL